MILKTLIYVAITAFPFFGAAQQSNTVTTNNAAIKQEDSSQNDFDFEIGSWKTSLKRLKDPLSGSSTWITYEGTSIVTPVCNGQANLVELDVAGSAGRIIGASLRLFNPQTKQWSLNYANMRDGSLAIPAVGSFKNGRGEFFNEDTFNGKKILVRFVISGITTNSCHFEQAYSADNGKTWEVNWIADDIRIEKKEF